MPNQPYFLKLLQIGPGRPKQNLWEQALKRTQITDISQLDGTCHSIFCCPLTPDGKQVKPCMPTLWCQYSYKYH